MFLAQKNESNNPDITGQLELALAWNRADIAKKEILTPERRTEWKVRDEYIYSNTLSKYSSKVRMKLVESS